MTIDVYLHFNGTCEDAFEFYRAIFGGEFAEINYYREAPPEFGLPEAHMDKVMHVSYPIGSTTLMGSDVPSCATPTTQGCNFLLSYSPTSKEEADSLFAQLSDGGAVIAPLQDMFWGAYFGSCKDKFGVQWQLMCWNEQAPQQDQ